MIVKSKAFLCCLAALILLIPAVSIFPQSYETLLSLLVDLPGYSGEEPEGMDVSSSDLKAVSVSREYSKGESELHAGILVGQQSAGVWNPGYQEGLKMETPEGLMEVKGEGGFLVFHSYNKKKQEGMIAVLLDKGGADGGGGAVFVFAYKGIDNNEGLSLAKKFDWKKIKAKTQGL
ncbi:MAG TPA: hypothetical protein VMZ05_06650 [Spirochaetota bacterium]|nr:hypothetical protein [Spirochaetota bacterium]